MTLDPVAGDATEQHDLVRFREAELGARFGPIYRGKQGEVDAIGDDPTRWFAGRFSHPPGDIDLRGHAAPAEPGDPSLPMPVDVVAVQSEHAGHATDEPAGQRHHSVVNVYQVVTARPHPAPDPRRGEQVVLATPGLGDHLDIDVRAELTKGLDRSPQNLQWAEDGIGMLRFDALGLMTDRNDLGAGACRPDTARR